MAKGAHDPIARRKTLRFVLEPGFAACAATAARTSRGDRGGGMRPGLACQPSPRVRTLGGVFLQGAACYAALHEG